MFPDVITKELIIHYNFCLGYFCLVCFSVCLFNMLIHWTTTQASLCLQLKPRSDGKKHAFVQSPYRNPTLVEDKQDECSNTKEPSVIVLSKLNQLFQIKRAQLHRFVLLQQDAWERLTPLSSECANVNRLMNISPYSVNNTRETQVELKEESKVSWRNRTKVTVTAIKQWMQTIAKSSAHFIDFYYLYLCIRCFDTELP